MWRVLKIRALWASGLPQWADAGGSSDNAAILLIAAAALIALIPLLASLRPKSSKRIAPSDGVLQVTSAPHQWPFVGHIARLVINLDNFLRGSRDGSTHGIFSINIFGGTHVMLYAPSLVSGLFSQRSTVIDFDSVVWQVLARVGGVANRWRDRFEGSFDELNHAMIAHLMREPALGQMIDTYMKNFQDMLPNLVSFLPQQIDHSIWEREAAAELVTAWEDPNPIMEADLLPLILHFIGAASQPALLGKDFVGLNPNFLHDMFEFNKIFTLLAAGIPSWAPIPSITRGVLARNRVIDAIRILDEAIAADHDGQPLPNGYDDLSDVAPIMRTRSNIMRKHGLPSKVAAVGDMSVVWALHANSNFAAYWLLLRIVRDPSLLREVRTEIAPYVYRENSSTTKIAGVLELPRIKVDHRGLASSCPLFKGCFIETMRLDSSPWSLRKIVQDFTVTESKTDAIRFTGKADAAPRTWFLQKGDYATTPHDLHFTDPKFWQDPTRFIPQRHIVHHDSVENKPAYSSAEWGTLRPFGGGSSMCKGRLFAEREVLAGVAGLLMTWDFEPQDGKWAFPRGDKATGVKMPNGDVRVRITRRSEMWD